MSTKLQREILKQTAYHEIGHALLYYHYELEFQYLTIKPTDLYDGHVRPAYDDRGLWFALVHFYFDRTATPLFIRDLKSMVKEHIDICIAGRLCALYYEHRDRILAYTEFISLYYEYCIDVRYYNIIEDLIVFYKMSDPVNKRKKVKVFGHINKELFFNSEDYSEVDAVFLEAHLALSLFYKSDQKKIASYYKRSAKRLLGIIEYQFDFIEYIASILLKKKELSFDQFEKLFKTFYSPTK